MTHDVSPLRIEFCGEWWTTSPGETLRIGREGELALDDNPFLHRSFLTIESHDALWWICNVGSRLSATVTDGSGGMHAQLPSGSRLPIVFALTIIVFTAGPTTYDLAIHAEAPPFLPAVITPQSSRATVGAVPFTEAQLRLLLALAEPVLRREGRGTSAIPTSAEAAKRLSWPITRFNRKLDNVCDKLTRAGVPGLRGDSGALAVNRRARLVEHVIACGLVTVQQLELLDVPETIGVAQAG